MLCSQPPELVVAFRQTVPTLVSAVQGHVRLCGGI